MSNENENVPVVDVAVPVDVPVDVPEIDPTMTDVPVDVPAPVIAPAPLPELRYEYQPSDAQGRPLGGKQVIVYTTPDQLAEKLRDQNVELIRKLREVTKNQRLGRTPVEDLPADLERLPETVEYKEVNLTPEEKYQLQQDLADPAKFDEARDRLFSSATGVSPKDFREQQNKQQMTVNQLLARTNAVQFIEQTPDFYLCSENLEVMTDWMIKNRLQPTVKNFTLAHSAMQEAGLLLSSPIAREVAPTVPAPVAAPTENTLPNPQATVEPAPRISSVEQPQQTSQPRVPSGLNSRVASNTGVLPISGTGTLTLAEIERMPSDEYKRRLVTDPKFVTLVNDLESKRPPRPRRS